jgi:hypothetical protein
MHNEGSLSKTIINIALIFITASMILIDVLAFYDIFTGEPDTEYQIGMIILSILVYIAIGYYLKQVKQRESQISQLNP